MMKLKTKMLALLALLPVLALADAGHADDHHDRAAAMPGMAQGAMPGMQHDMHADMHANSHREGQASAAGSPGDAAQVSRTVKLTMGDNMRFEPATLQVKAGETVRFFLVNPGKLAHEMVIGTADELAAHAQQMRAMPNMVHRDANMIRLEPGQRGGIVWRFDQAGSVKFACLVPGHMEAGMVGTVEVR